MDYNDEVFNWLKTIEKGTKIDVYKAKNPDKFIKAVKYLMDGEWIIGFTFSNDYKYLKRNN